MQSIKDTYQRITDAIIEQLEAGTKPWIRPWRGNSRGSLVPRRATGEAYRGINVLMLWLANELAGYEENTWMTYRQAVRRESRMKGVPHGSMSSVQLCRHFPHGVLATARCEAGKEARDGNAANAFCRARRRSEGRTRVNSH